MSWTLHLRSRRRRAQILNKRCQTGLALLMTNHAKAEACLIRVLDACLRHLGERQLVTLETRRALGTVQHYRGRYGQAEETLLVAIAAYDLSDENHRIGQRQARSWLAAARAQAGRPEQAVDELRAVVAECIGEWGSDAPIALLCRLALGHALTHAGQEQEAAEVLSELVQSHIRLSGVRARQTLCARHGFGTALVQLGELDHAELEFHAVLADPGTHRSCQYVCWGGLAKVAAGRDQRDEAVRLYEKAIAGWIDLGGEDHPYVREVRDELAALPT